MTVTQADKGRRFRALHEAPGAFVIANVWDGGSARMMAGVGFAALATWSGASAGLLGRRDGRVTRDEALAQALVWRLYEDVARPARWIELWAKESWTDQPREATLLDGGGL